LGIILKKGGGRDKRWEGMKTKKRTASKVCEGGLILTRYHEKIIFKKKKDCWL